MNRFWASPLTKFSSKISHRGQSLPFSPQILPITLQKHCTSSQKKAFSALRGKGAKSTAFLQHTLSKKGHGNGKTALK